MKVSFFEKITKKSNIQNEEKRIKKYFQILILVFAVTFFTFLSINEFIKENEAECSNSQDYVSVFNETDLKKVLFYSYEDNKEK